MQHVAHVTQWRRLAWPPQEESATRLQGMFSDATLLDISDVELADIKFLEDDPVIVVQFNCQQVG